MRCDDQVAIFQDHDASLNLIRCDDQVAISQDHATTSTYQYYGSPITTFQDHDARLNLMRYDGSAASIHDVVHSRSHDCNTTTEVHDQVAHSNSHDSDSQATTFSKHTVSSDFLDRDNHSTHDIGKDAGTTAEEGDIHTVEALENDDDNNENTTITESASEITTNKDNNLISHVINLFKSFFKNHNSNFKQSSGAQVCSNNTIDNKGNKTEINLFKIVNITNK